jgi:hypothetical protein
MPVARPWRRTCFRWTTTVSEIDVPPGDEPLARRGARACPERIIVVEEDAADDANAAPRT